MKKFLLGCLVSVSFSGFAACPAASPTNSANFCGSFKVAAVCYCTSSGIPSGMCQNMDSLYDRMISIFGSIERACAYQRNTSSQECIDDWNCYRDGGVDSLGRDCSSTKNSCR